LLNNTNWPNTYTLLPVLGCALVILSSIENNKSLLRWWPLQKIGDISYSLYLWHWIVCAYMTNADINFTAKNIAIAIFVSTFAAIISYNYFERWKVGGVKAFLGTSIVAIGCMATVNAHIIDSSKKSLSSLLIAERTSTNNLPMIVLSLVAQNLMMNLNKINV
jgi:peptidoglycan/LPS O-acetylase OafA/YrhL